MYEKLLASLADTDAKIDALLAKPSLNEAEEAEYEKLTSERKATAKQLARVKAQQDSVADRERLEAEAQAATATAQLNERRQARTVSVGALTTRDVPHAASPTSTGRAAAAVRHDAEGRIVGFFEDTDETITMRFGEDRNAQRRQSYREQRRANNRILKSSGYVPWGEFRSASDFIRSGLASHGHPRFEERVNRHFAPMQSLAVQGMSEGIGSDGGYTVMPEFNMNIIDRVYSNPLWEMTDNYTVSGNNMTFLANAETSRATGSRHGGLRGYWLSEGSTVTSSKPTLREVSIKLAKLGVVVYLTQELLDDGGSALQEYVARKAAEEFNFLIGDALVNGTGAGQPLGMLNAPSLISIAKESGQSAATLQTENLTKMYSRFYAPNYGSAVWLRHQDVAPQLMTLTLGIGAAGVATYMPPGAMSSMPYENIIGRPALVTEFNATLGTQGDVLLCDMGQILSISKGGVAQAVSTAVQFLSDQIAIRFIIRINATPWENAAITPYKGSNTQGNFITLDSRS